MPKTLVSELRAVNSTNWDFSAYNPQAVWKCKLRIPSESHCPCFLSFCIVVVTPQFIYSTTAMSQKHTAAATSNGSMLLWRVAADKGSSQWDETDKVVIYLNLWGPSSSWKHEKRSEGDSVIMILFSVSLFFIHILIWPWKTNPQKCKRTKVFIHFPSGSVWKDYK